MIPGLGHCIHNSFTLHSTKQNGAIKLTHVGVVVEVGHRGRVLDAVEHLGLAITDSKNQIACAVCVGDVCLGGSKALKDERVM